MPRVTTLTLIFMPSAVGYSTGFAGIDGIGISGATGMPFANGTVCCAETLAIRNVAANAAQVLRMKIPPRNAMPAAPRLSRSSPSARSAPAGSG